MGERMTSPEEAAEMKYALMGAVEALERYGYDRGQIGAVMAGVGLALTSAHSGDREALRIWESVRGALMSSVTN